MLYFLKSCSGTDIRIPMNNNRLMRYCIIIGIFCMIKQSALFFFSFLLINFHCVVIFASHLYFSLYGRILRDSYLRNDCAILGEERFRFSPLEESVIKDNRRVHAYLLIERFLLLIFLNFEAHLFKFLVWTCNHVIH